MKHANWIALLLLGVASFTTGCRKADDPASTSATTDTSINLQLRFLPVVNGASLQLDSVWYRNAAGDSFRVTSYLYYASNFSLETESGQTIALPQTYILVSARDLQLRRIPHIPAGSYRKISFLLGVDSTRNVSGAQTGDLSQGNGMFWDWQAGYIMAKLEGYSPQSAGVDQGFSYHIAGFTGKNNALRRVTLDLPTTLNAATGQSPTVYVQSDVASWFSGSAPFSIRDVYGVMDINQQSASIATNYSKGFSVVRIDP